MPYVNCGAYVGGKRPTTKKALKDTMKANPASVTFDCTSIFDKYGTIQGDNIPSGVTLSVVGPDPFGSRKWYASVTSQGRVS